MKNSIKKQKLIEVKNSIGNFKSQKIEMLKNIVGGAAGAMDNPMFDQNISLREVPENVFS